MRSQLPLLLSVLATPLFGAAVPVKIVPGHGLERGGGPYFVKGAGGTEHLEELVKRGGNSIRTWGSDDLAPLLERADQLHLTVCAGIWLEPECSWFSYKNPEHCARQLERVRKVIREYRDAPALMFWGLGNEMEGDGRNAAYWQQLEKLAKLVHEEDPAHLCCTALAGMQAAKAAGLNQYAPSLDFIGINTYGGLSGLRKELTEIGWKRPWVVTEFGCLGPWERPKTEWGAPLEQTAEEKAAMLTTGYAANIAPAGDCLGSYAFLWGEKQEGTSTWFSLIDADGEATAAADALTVIWSGKPPANRAPQITKFVSSAAKAKLKRGEAFTASAEARDPEGDTLRWEWSVYPESAGRDKEGREKPVTAVPGCIPKANTAIEGTAPNRAGAYRLFVKVTDGKGAVATQNVPFRVE